MMKTPCDDDDGCVSKVSSSNAVTRSPIDARWFYLFVLLLGMMLVVVVVVVIDAVWGKKE